MTEINGYYLTKVTQRKWAERLLDGELFMQPLSNFGDLRGRPEESQNDFRGDILEGTMAVTSSTDSGSTFVKDAFGDGFPVDGRLVWLSEDLYQRRVYCLYCFEYSTKASSFVAPNARVCELGDTAVLIIDPIEFFARLRRCIAERSIALSMCAAKRVNYVMDSSTCGEYDEFAKSPSYSWQNEYRFSIDLAMGKPDWLAWYYMSDLRKILFLNQGGEVDLASFEVASTDICRAEWATMGVLRKIQSLNEQSRFLYKRCLEEKKIVRREPLTLQMGSLRDICVSISATDLIALRLPAKFDHNPYVVPPLHRSAIR
jgi:hypothetical protein